jgi:methylmalonyl-CoA/ethylmalonyl-CoA epimerase
MADERQQEDSSRSGRPGSSAPLTFHHIGLAVWTMEPIRERLCRLFGAGVGPGGSDERLNIEWCWLAAPSNPVLELLSPLEGPGPVRRFLERHGEGLHHVSFHAADLDDAMAHVSAVGEEPFRVSRDHAGYEEFFLRPERTGGALFHVFRELDAAGDPGPR